MSAAASQRKLRSRRPPTDCQRPAVETCQVIADARRHHEERECAQFLRAQQKLVGKKTTNEYARIRLVHRLDEKERKRHLHQNGSKTMSATHAKGDKKATPGCESRKDSGVGDASSARALSARDLSPHVSDAAKQSTPKRTRPQSAKAVRENRSRNDSDGVMGRHVSVPLLERCIYNPIPLTTHLVASRSAPRPQKMVSGPTVPAKDSREQLHESEPSVDAAPKPARHHIVVHMRRLEVQDEEEDDDALLFKKSEQTRAVDPRPPVRRAWGDGE